MNQSYKLYYEALKGEITPQYAYSHLSEDKNNCKKIHVLPSDIVHMLQRFLRKEINAEQLTSWSSFLLMEDVYISPECSDEDRYETMWWVLQQLSTPVIDGAITHEKVMKHINDLD